ncbi:MAG: aminotransferase class IV [Bacteroidota bacterium]
MSQFIETIKCKDGILYNLEFHQGRFDRAILEHFPVHNKIRLSEEIQIPHECRIGLFRCRVIYNATIEKIEFLPHQYRNVISLKLLEDNHIDYSYKFTKRDKLIQLYEKRGDCDDILIVKDDCITDSFTANPVFFDGAKWWTPNTPLLAGTQRARLIYEGKIDVCRITPDDLCKYKKAGLINAMQDFDDMPVIPVNNIK